MINLHICNQSLELLPFLFFPYLTWALSSCSRSCLGSHRCSLSLHAKVPLLTSFARILPLPLPCSDALTSLLRLWNSVMGYCSPSTSTCMTFSPPLVLTTHLGLLFHSPLFSPRGLGSHLNTPLTLLMFWYPALGPNCLQPPLGCPLYPLGFQQPYYAKMAPHPHLTMKPALGCCFLPPCTSFHPLGSDNLL